MYNTTHKRKARRAHGRGNHFFAPAFGNIIHEILNSPINEIIHEGPKKYTYPPVNVIKEDGKYIIATALPGVAKEDVAIKIEKNKLIIKSDADDNTEAKYRLREFNYAKFERSFTLSEDADTDNISAKFENGILNITIPTIKEAGPVEVKIG